MWEGLHQHVQKMAKEMYDEWQAVTAALGEEKDSLATIPTPH